jgi:choline dehydrogenase
MSADYIIVGAGTAGCVLAERLSARGLRVLLLEAGGDHRHMHVQIPAAFPKLFKTQRDWAYSTTPQAALNNRAIFWPRGKMLGGSSSMNAQIHQWYGVSDFDEWNVEGWRAADLTSALARVDRELNGGTLREPNPLTNAFIQSAAASGLRTAGSYNGDVLEPGAWIAEVTHRDGARLSAADAYLGKAKAAGARIITHTHVQRVLFDGKRAIGVELRQGADLQRLTASAGIILCGGAINTPQLLMLSGIGPGEHLKSLNIHTLHHAPEVGANLQDHLMFVMHYRATRPISLRSAESPANLLRYVLKRRGMLASNIAEAIAFITSDGSDQPDLEIVFAPALFENEGLTPPSAHGFSMGIVLLTPESRGRITLASPDPSAAPLIDPAYLSDPSGLDLARIVNGARRADAIATQNPLAGESSGALWPRAFDDGAIAAAVRASAHTIYHPVGSCRIGNDEASVVDRGLAVRGVERLWAADASIMPRIPRGHPNAVVAAIADRAGALFNGA